MFQDRRSLQERYCVVSSGLDNDAACHFKEHSAFKSLVEVLATHHLPMFQQEDGIMIFQKHQSLPGPILSIPDDNKELPESRFPHGRESLLLR